MKTEDLAICAASVHTLLINNKIKVVMNKRISGIHFYRSCHKHFYKLLMEMCRCPEMPDFKEYTSLRNKTDFWYYKSKGLTTKKF